MAFVDEITVAAAAGKGGNGVVRWLHIKGKEKGGPAGGNGGRGGDVVVEGVRDLGALASYRFVKEVAGEPGEPGDGNNKHGANGEPAVLRVPIGTQIKNEDTGESFEVLEEGKQTVILKGGAGGFGNAQFKGPTNQNPFDSTPGKPGAKATLHLTLKLIADVGFVGYPNAGKSSLLNALTRAKSKVGAYPFTTLDPHLGDFYGYILADIPGLIEGASDGRGLGSKFLRHIERTGFIAHLVSAEQEDPAEAYRAIRAELSAAGSSLSDKPEMVILTKVDLVSASEQGKKLEALAKEAGQGVVPVSIIDDELLKAFSDELTKRLRNAKAEA